jgi:hypothetical protein
MMTTTEERMRILKMIEDETVTPEEGAELLQALQSGARSVVPASDKRWFRLRVTDLASGEVKFSVNIPVSLVHVGLKMGARFVPQVEGVEVDSVMARILEGEEGKLLDAIDEDGNERFELFVE